MREILRRILASIQSSAISTIIVGRYWLFSTARKRIEKSIWRIVIAAFAVDCEKSDKISSALSRTDIQPSISLTPVFRRRRKNSFSSAAARKWSILSSKGRTMTKFQGFCVGSARVTSVTAAASIGSCFPCFARISTKWKKRYRSKSGKSFRVEVVSPNRRNLS